jgi:hypothetical protein
VQVAETDADEVEEVEDAVRVGATSTYAVSV